MLLSVYKYNCFFFFFFKQKTAYEITRRDWSSDVCSSDLFIAAHYGSDPTRNGEPFGELGLIRQQDAAWGDQKGQPRDPQAGNTPGGQRDVLRTSGIRPINSPDTDPPAAGELIGRIPEVRST